MLSRFVGAALVLFIGGVVVAADYVGLVTKADKSSITFTTKGKKEVTVKVNGSTAYTKGDDTLTAKDFDALVTKATDPDSKSKRKGVFAKISTDGEGDKETAKTVNVVVRKKKKDKTN
jgi:hypothetical protein